MPNFLIDNTYHVLDTSATALPWPTAGARIKSITLVATNTLAAVDFLINVGTPIFRFRFITHGAVNLGSSASVVPSTYSHDYGGVRFQTAWIPSTLTACSVWLHFI